MFVMNDNSMNNKIKALIDQTINDQLESEIKDNISNDLNDLYDYSSIKEITVKNNINQQISLVDKINSFDFAVGQRCGSNEKQQRDGVENFLNGIKNGEKVITYFSNQIHCGAFMEFSILYKYMFITNRGKMLAISGTQTMSHPNIQYTAEYCDLNFWIPVDYIAILNNAIDASINYFNEKPRNSNDFIKLLADMKTSLYNRKYMPLYAVDALKENDELKKKYVKAETSLDLLRESYIRATIDLENEVMESKRINEHLKTQVLNLSNENDKLKNENIALKNMYSEYDKLSSVIMHPHNQAILDMDIERNKIDEEKQKLEIAAQKLSAERKQFDEERKYLEQKIKEYEKLKGSSYM